MLFSNEVVTDSVHHGDALWHRFDHAFDHFGDQIAWCKTHALCHDPIDEQALKQLAKEVQLKVDQRMTSLKIIRGYVAPVAKGDMTVLQDENCKFFIEFMTALSTQEIKRRA